MTFKDISARVTPTIQLPIPTGEGPVKKYTISSPSAALGEWLVSVHAITQRAHQFDQQGATPDTLTEAQASELEVPDLPDGVPPTSAGITRALLGPAYDEMLADGVPHEYMALAKGVVTAWVVGSREDAEEFWATGGSKKAPKAPADRKPKKKSSPQT